jgi:START domain
MADLAELQLSLDKAVPVALSGDGNDGGDDEAGEGEATHTSRKRAAKIGRSCMAVLRAHCDEGGRDYDEGWEVVKEGDGVVVCRQHLEGESLLLFRATGDVECKLETAFHLAHDADLRKKFDVHCESFRIVEDLGRHRDGAHEDELCLTVAHNHMKSLAPLMSPRDAALLRSAVHPDDSDDLIPRDWAGIAAVSCLHDDIPEISGVVRSKVYVSGWYLKKIDENKTRLSYVLHADPWYVFFCFSFRILPPISF